jgi:tRNA modification GTPase
MSDSQQDEIPHHEGAPAWRVRNKIDLGAAGSDASAAKQPSRVLAEPGDTAVFRISASRGDGMAELVAGLVAFAEEYFGSDDGALIGRERQRKLLQETAASLQRSIAAIGFGEELVAEELRAATYALGRMLGRVDVEDVLDVIFREFCIGK